MTTKNCRLLTAIALGLTITAHTATAASVLATGALPHSATLSANCLVTNVGTKPMEVEVDVYRYDVLQSSYTLAVFPQGTNGTSAPGGAGGDRCVFRGSGSAKSLRGALVLTTAGGDTVASIPAL